MDAASGRRVVDCGPGAGIVAAVIAALDTDTQEQLATVLYVGTAMALGLWAVVGAWRWRAVRAADTGVLGVLRQNGAGLVAALVITLIAPLVAEPQLRMQFDETSVCGAAQGMHLERHAMMGTAALPAAGGLDGATAVDLVEHQLDKRPPLLAFLVAVAHDVVGYSVNNAFGVNLTVLFLLLATLAVAVRRRFGVAAAVAVPVLVGSVPLVVAVATSAGLELLAVLVLAWVVLAALGHAANPSPARGAWLVANVLLVSFTRYESMLLGGLVVVLALVCPSADGARFAERWRRRAGIGWRGIAVVAIASLLAVPLLVLAWHGSDAGFYPEAEGRPLVAVSHLSEHVGPFIAALFDPGLGHVWPGPVALVGAIAIVVWLARERQPGPALIVGLPVMAGTGIVLLWFFGDVAEATGRRLYLPIVVLVSAAPALLVPRDNGRTVAGALLAVFAVTMGALRFHEVATTPLLQPFRAARVLELIDGVVAEIPHRAERTMWVTTVAQYFIVNGRAAVPPKTFDAVRERLGEFDVFVLETPFDSGFAPLGSPSAVLAQRSHQRLGSLDDPDTGEPVVTVYRVQQ